MDVKNHGKEIRKHLNLSFWSNIYVSISSFDIENNPTVTSFETLFLNNQIGFYFEKYTTTPPQQANENNIICTLTMNRNTWSC